MKLQASSAEELDEDEDNDEEKRKRRRKGGRGREYEMRVFGEKDTGWGGAAGGSVERDERIVEFETTLREEERRRKQRGIQSSGRRSIG